MSISVTLFPESMVIIRNAVSAAECLPPMVQPQWHDGAVGYKNEAADVSNLLTCVADR